MKYMSMLFMSLLFTLHLCAKSAQKANSNVSDVVTYDSVSQQTNADSTVLIAYEKISTVGYKYFESLHTNKRKPLHFVPRKVFNDSFYLLDRAYYAKTLWKTHSYTLKIYKSGTKYHNRIGDENVAPVDYLVLVTIDRSQHTIDYLVCFYTVRMLYEMDERFFHIDNKGYITLTNFYYDEIEMQYKGKKRYKISPNGKFVLTQ